MFIRCRAVLVQHLLNMEIAAAYLKGHSDLILGTQLKREKNLENIKWQVKLFTLNSDFNLQLVGYANNSPTFNIPVGRPNIPLTNFNNISKSGSNFIPFRLFILQMTQNNFISMSAGFELWSSE